MGTSRTDTKVLCPFYHQDNAKMQRIFCEGLVEKSCLALIYQTKRDYRAQLNLYCCKDYVRCEIYRMLMQKYED